LLKNSLAIQIKTIETKTIISANVFHDKNYIFNLILLKGERNTILGCIEFVFFSNL